MQLVQTCLAKAGVCFTNLAEKLPDQSHVTEVVKGLALLGHGFHHLCLRRRELLKYDLKQDYAHLCSPSVKYSDFLFGNDIEKKVTEIKNLNQVGSKIRGFSRGRGWRGNARGRGFRPLNWRQARFQGRDGPYHPGSQGQKWGRGQTPKKGKATDKE